MNLERLALADNVANEAYIARVFVVGYRAFGNERIENAFLIKEHAIIYAEHMQERWNKFKWFVQEINVFKEIDPVLDLVEHVNATI